ncbi:MAG: hypothetical protein ABIQ82_04990, partial [Variovorax sp.]
RDYALTFASASKRSKECVRGRTLGAHIGVKRYFFIIEPDISMASPSFIFIDVPSFVRGQRTHVDVESMT